MIEAVQFPKSGEIRVMRKSFLFALSVAVGALVCSQSAQAGGPVTASLSATYYQVLGNSGDPDFNVFSTPNVAPGKIVPEPCLRTG